MYKKYRDNLDQINGKKKMSLVDKINNLKLDDITEGSFKDIKDEDLPLINSDKAMKLPDDKLFPRLFHATAEKNKCKSLLKKYLSKELYEKLKDKKTKLNGTLYDCIRSGCVNLDSGVGLYACDPDAYTVFKELFDAVIKDYHKVDEVSHPTPFFGEDDLTKDEKLRESFDSLKKNEDMIVSTRVRVGRSHSDVPFPPCITNEKRKEIFTKSKGACEKLTGELKGTVYSLEGMSKADEQKLINDHFLFKNDDRFLEAAGGYKDWPNGRAIFHNKDKTFLVWINEEDHLRFISMQKGGDLKEVYLRLVGAIHALEKELTFAKTKEHGYLTFCPTNLGTTCRASVHIKVPKLAAAKKLDDLCAKLNLQPRGIHGEHTESVGGVYDISNKRRLGLTEFQAIKEMCLGVAEIMKQERECK